MMAATLVERVALAIVATSEAWGRAQHNPNDTTGFAEFVARAAIEAMRQPTEAMVASRCLLSDYFSEHEAREFWETMIDVALKEPTP